MQSTGKSNIEQIIPNKLPSLSSTESSIEDNYYKELIDLSKYLNDKYKFNISQSTLIIAAEMLSKINIYDKDEFVNMLKPIFCHSSTQYECFDNAVNDFVCYKYKKIVDINGEEKKEEIKKNYNKIIKKTKDSYKKETQENIIYQENQDLIKTGILTVTETLYKEMLAICSKDNAKISNFIIEEIQNNSSEKIFEIKKIFIPFLKYIMKESNNDQKLISYIIECGDNYSKIEKKISDILNAEKEKMSSELAEIEKEMSMMHRDIFIGGQNAVRLLSDVMEENLTELDTSDMSSLMKYIKQNAYKFKTKIAHNMKRNVKKKINFKRTIKSCVKYDGIPVEIKYERPKPSKVKIVSILDVSGSCIKSATVLLDFLYELQSVFPRGCESYVFVSKLKKVTDIFRDNPLEIACQKAVRAVPREYSNYDNAFEIFENEYIKDIDKDTIVLFLGDARNNKNHHRSEFLQQVHKTAKKVYWLETDPKEKWGEGDSAIYKYTPYVDKIYEILTANDIINFLSLI